jgi:glycyl-tRNA synthetase beta chain
VEILPQAILSLTFPKSMYWTEKSAPRFVRPIRWVLAILGEGKQAKTLRFEILGVKSGDFTFGHRNKSARPLRVTGFRDYRKKLLQAHVEIDPALRRGSLNREAQALVEKAGLKIVQDEWLADWIANSTEWPRAMLGGFEERFLHLPREILITVMRDHQKYFAVEDGQGKLRPHFVAVLNMDPDAKGLIRQGHERVLRARFTDAEFFWNADQKTPLEKRFELLEKVTYHERLGSYADKGQRMRLISQEVAQPSTLSGEAVAHLRRAIWLSKCDLTTQMVQEFPELQGKVGGLYARAQGEREEVCEAIYEHYLPQGFEDQSPKSLLGALTSLIDKFDAVLAGYAARLEPVGSNDPFGMRRNAAGITKVLLEFSLPIDLEQLITGSYARLELGANRPGNEVYGPLLDFFGDRLRYYLEDIRGFRYDTVRAVMAAGFEVPLDASARAEAVHALRGGEDFEAVSAAAKRIRNILAKSATAADWQPGEIETSLLKEPEEIELDRAYREVAGEVGRHRAERQYRRALEAISTLRPAVDRFFDKVLVMAEDREIRRNRLRLLKKLDELFSGIADFAEIASESGS